MAALDELKALYVARCRDGGLTPSQSGKRGAAWYRHKQRVREGLLLAPLWALSRRGAAGSSEIQCVPTEQAGEGAARLPPLRDRQGRELPACLPSLRSIGKCVAVF